MKNRLPLFLALLVWGGFGLAFSASAEEAKTKNKTFYRYTNAQGTKVIGQTIPPQHVRAGYEIVTINGEVIKVVAASPSEADAQRVAKERKMAREQARADLVLRRTYSKAHEIDAAKARHLIDLRNNINILQASFLSVKSQLKEQETHAATMERSGQKVPEDIVSNITTLRTEEKDVAAKIKQREIELQAAADKFDKDKKRFVEINKTP